MTEKDTTLDSETPVQENALTEQISSDDVGDALSILGMPISKEDMILNSAFVQKYPGLEKILVKSPDMDKIRGLLDYFDHSLYTMEGGAKFEPDKIALVKKLDAAKPDYRMGQFSKSGSITSYPSLKLIPLFSYTTKVYWPPYDSPQKTSVCNSTNNFSGIFNDDENQTKYIRECETCPFKDWVNGSKPKCNPSDIFLCVTPEFDALYEVRMSTYCRAVKTFNATNKLIIAGRMMGVVQPTIDQAPVDYVKQHRINSSRIDGSTTWIELSGQTVEKEKKIVSAGTIVTKTNERLTAEEIILVSLYKKFAMDYVSYVMSNFYKFQLRVEEENSVRADEVADENYVQNEVIEDADILDDIEDVEVDS